MDMDMVLPNASQYVDCMTFMYGTVEQMPDVESRLQEVKDLDQMLGDFAIKFDRKPIVELTQTFTALTLVILYSYLIVRFLNSGLPAQYDAAVRDRVCGDKREPILERVGARQAAAHFQTRNAFRQVGDRQSCLLCSNLTPLV